MLFICSPRIFINVTFDGDDIADAKCLELESTVRQTDNHKIKSKSDGDVCLLMPRMLCAVASKYTQVPARLRDESNWRKLIRI